MDEEVQQRILLILVETEAAMFSALSFPAKQVATYITTSKRAIINTYHKWKQHTAAGV